MGNLVRKFVLAFLVCGIVASAAPAWALQCVPYARQASGLSLQGDAWRWWSAAEGVYERGNAPLPGAVMVFKSTKAMRHGHVAVVSRIVSRREIRIDHANWGQGRHRGKIERDVAVLDVSPRNDWTQVRVWHEGSDSYGVRVNPVFGFIYQPGAHMPSHSVAASHSAKNTAHPAQQAVSKVKFGVPAPKPAAPAASAAEASEPRALAHDADAGRAKVRPGADDLNRLVLARLQGEAHHPRPAAVAGDRSKTVLGEKPPAPKPSSRAAAATKAKPKPLAEKHRS